jgi:hypothetical protein
MMSVCCIDHQCLWNWSCFGCAETNNSDSGLLGYDTVQSGRWLAPCRRIYCLQRSRDSAVGMATGWTAERSEFESREGQDVSSLHVVQTGSGAHPASYPMGIGGSFPGGKAVRAWSWPLNSNYCRGQEYVNLYIHSPIRLHGVVLN